LSGVKPALLFIAQSIVVGLAVAFLVVLARPDLLPGAGLAGNGARASYADAIAISAPSVASVRTKRLVEYRAGPDDVPRFRVERAVGSAVVIDPDGYLVTNFHVIAEATDIQLQLADGRLANPEIVGVDAETDLALLKVDLGVLPAIPMGSSSQIRIGDVVLAIGNPVGLTSSVTQGIISATGRNHLLELTTFQDFIQTDAAINAGNSGGALINVDGQLIGINTAILARNLSTEGIGFAIPVDLVRGVAEEIREHGRVIRGYFGLQPDDMTQSEREAQGLEGDAGILLSVVFEGSPAEAAGLREGDIIIAINGEPIISQRQAQLLVAGSSPGDRVAVTGIRDGERFTTTVIATERPGYAN
jgi:serine peptidase DegS